MRGVSKDFGLIKADKVFRIKRVLCNDTFRETIVISVGNVLFEAGLNGPADLNNVGFAT